MMIYSFGGKYSIFIKMWNCLKQSEEEEVKHTALEQKNMNETRGSCPIIFS